MARPVGLAVKPVATRLDDAKAQKKKFQHDAVLNTDSIHDDPLADRLDAKKVIVDAMAN